MDPDATLQTLRDAMAAFRGEPDAAGALWHADDALTAFEALDEWLTRGGFLPADWRNATL